MTADHAGAGRHWALVAAAVIAVAGSGCTAASFGPVVVGPASTPHAVMQPAVMVLKHGAGNGDGDIFIAPQRGGGGFVASQQQVPGCVIL
jgi:hypothetical protein